MTDAYTAFLQAKVPAVRSGGFEVPPYASHPWLKPHAAAVARKMCAMGRYAVFASFGLQKTSTQLEAGRLVLAHVGEGARGLIVCPLGVRQEFMRDAASLGLTIRFVQSIVETFGPGLYLTNYETVREGKLDPSSFDFASLDEAAILRGFGGSKTFREFMRLFDAVPYRFVATATPSPNEFIELLAYAAFLGVMDVGEAKTRFFRRNSEKADELTLHPHKEREFWLWVSSWALFITSPADLGFDATGYVLQPMRVRWHEVAVDHAQARPEKSGQGVLFREASLGVVESSAEKRATLFARVAKLTELIAEDPAAHRIIWHDLEAERALIEDAVPGVVTIFGTQDLGERDKRVLAFSDGLVKDLAAKPVMAGAGCNFQRHCHRAVYVGVGFKFHDFIQSVHRIQRFGQTQPVEVDVIYAESERGVRRELERKWKQHNIMVEKMVAIIREHGLSQLDMGAELKRALFDPAERVESVGDGYRLVNSDCVIECARMDDACVDLIVTSIPFSTQYEYTPSFNDFGHTDSNEHFWKQMKFLAPQLFRVLKPGRDLAIHVKDRIVPGGLTGLGFQTVYPFADDCRAVFRQAGFAYLGEKTNLTDVVRENNQTYRLGHTEQLKDGTRMGAGLPEKVLLFRRPPSDSADGYADTPVVKPRPSYVDREGRPAAYSREREQAGTIRPTAGTGYSRGRWQVDAHHLMRTSGDRLIAPEEWAGFESVQVFRLWKAMNLTRIYDFEHHVAIGEALAFEGRLPPDFMLLPPHSWHPDVWSDVVQMRSLNTEAAAAGAEKHLCPLPFDIVDRLISQLSMPGEVVFDPFAGIGTVPYRALKLRRQGWGVELNPGYFLEACKYAEAMARKMAMPTLFDLTGDAPGAPAEREVAA